MNSFNFNRFWRTLRWVLSVNRHKLMLWTAGVAVGTLVYELLFLWGDNGVNYRSSLGSIGSLSTFVIFMAICIGLCSITAGMNKKASRCSMLMLPASNAEKFLSLLAYVSVVWPLCIFLAYAVGDTLRMALRAWLYGDGWLSCVPQVLDNMLPFAQYGLWQETVFMVACFVFVHSWFVLVGTALRRYAFIVSNLILMFVIVLIAYLTARLMSYYGIDHINLFHQSCVHRTMVHYDVNPVAYPLTILLFALAGANYRQAYRIFKAVQLIASKWTNYNIPNHWKRYDIFIR